MNKASSIKYSFFFDFHTPAAVPSVGEKFDAEKFTAQLEDCGVDFLTCHARCNRGNAYYNTGFGKRHPGLKFDLIRELGEACRRKGIRFSVYFNAHLSEEEMIAHPEWTEQPLHPERKNPHGPFYRQACYNTAYAGHLCAMTKELAEEYPVDGFFYDCLMPSDCVCPVCVEEMRKMGYDPQCEEDVQKFSDFSSARLCRKLHEVITSVKPDALIFFNGRPFEEIAPLVSHFEAECLPTADWGYETLPVMTHHLHTLNRKKAIINMTGRFNNWGDFGGLRTQAGLEYDMFYGLAHGYRPDISDHMMPSYAWPQPVADLVKKVYDCIRPFDVWTTGAVKEPEIALFSARPGIQSLYPDSPEVKAAVRMLTELKVQFELITENSDLRSYRLIILPDNFRLTEKAADILRRHLEKGGKILAFGSAGLSPDRDEFALSDWPVKYISQLAHDPLYYQPEGDFAKNLPDMPLSVYASGAKVEAVPGAVVHMEIVKPVFNREWDGLRCKYYAAPAEKSGEPFIVEKNNIICVTGEIFTGYKTRAPFQHRELVKNLLGVLDKTPQLREEGLPSFARAFLQKNDGKILLHLLSYCPEKRCDAICVDERVISPESNISIRLDGKKVNRVFLAPEEKVLEYTVEDDYCKISVPQFSGYTLVVVE